MATGAIVARIVSQYTDKGAKAARKDIAKLGANFDKFAKKVGKAFLVAGAASAAFAVKIGKDAVQAAMEDQKSQSLLANSLRNTVGATDAAIASVEEYISKQQALFSVADDKLRPSLSALAAATGSITTAQQLQNTALDIAADKQIDLQTASVLLAKGFNGNLTALKKLYPQISAATIKSKDFEGALALVAKASGGAAAASADTLAGRLEGLKLAYGEILETLGYALLPVLTEFAGYIRDTLLPLLDQWVTANKDQIAASLQKIIDVVLIVASEIGKFFGFISRNIKTLEIFGSILFGIFVGAKIAAGISALITSIGLLSAAFVGQTAAASSAAIATGFATAGVSIALGAAAAITFYLAMKKVNGSVIDNTAAVNDSVIANSHLAELQSRYIPKVINLTKILTKEERIAAALAAANAKKAAKAAADLLLTEKALAALKKLGANVKGETDPITLRAAELNLMKQQMITQQAADFAAVQRLGVQLLANAAVQRYVDLLGVVSDQVISTEEIALLSAKWGITKDAVVAYITAIFATNDAKLSPAEIDLLAKQWGVTKAQAEMYLDFFKAINDGKLSPDEVNALATKWGLTNQQVTDYANKISEGVTPSDLWPTPGNQATKSWQNALIALNAYLLAVGAGVLTPMAPTLPTIPTPVVPLVPGKDFNPYQNRDRNFDLLNPTAPATESFSEMKLRSEALAKTTQGITGGFTDSQNTARLTAMGGAGGFTDSPNSARPVTINVTVQGSVTAERDLATSIRNALLVDQSNGNSITYTSAL